MHEQKGRVHFRGWARAHGFKWIEGKAKRSKGSGRARENGAGGVRALRGGTGKSPIRGMGKGAMIQSDRRERKAIEGKDFLERDPCSEGTAAPDHHRGAEHERGHTIHEHRPEPGLLSSRGPNRSNAASSPRSSLKMLVVGCCLKLLLVLLGMSVRS